LLVVAEASILPGEEEASTQLEVAVAWLHQQEV
jgi:hypothetical protein